MHEELCELPLKSGKRVYVDKTFAETKASAQRIFAVAEDHGAPCFSASALRFASELRGLSEEGITGLVSVGPGLLDNYSIHQIEPIVALMGPDIKQVCFTGTEAMPALTLEYSDGRRAHFSHHGWDCPFAMTVDLKGEKTRRIEIQSDYFRLFMEDMVRFFLGGEPPVSHQDTIAVIAVREAAIKASQDPGRWVRL